MNISRGRLEPEAEAVVSVRDGSQASAHIRWGCILDSIPALLVEARRVKVVRSEAEGLGTFERCMDSMMLASGSVPDSETIGSLGWSELRTRPAHMTCVEVERLAQMSVRIP